MPCIRLSQHSAPCETPPLSVESALSGNPDAIAQVNLTGLSCFRELHRRTFAPLTEIYGTLGAAIALMWWLYFSSLAILIGAELNAQL